MEITIDMENIKCNAKLNSKLRFLPINDNNNGYGNCRFLAV
jgi:hypothetical protein